MTYYLDLFSPETYEAFSKSDRSVSGFRPRQRGAAQKIRPGDRLVCYMTKLSRWVGILEVESGPQDDNTPLFYTEDDPFTVRFKVKPLVWLPKEKALPIREERVWNALSFTRELDTTSHHWTAMVRCSLRELDPADGATLERLLQEQATGGTEYPVDEGDYKKLVFHRVRRLNGTVGVSVPEAGEDETGPALDSDVRESLRVQAMLADIGAKMGMRVWIPRADRARVDALREESETLLDVLPLNYDDATIRTIEQIDVIWLRGRSIVRAFEVEHTTSIYSGILRMADLLALQPNMDIRLHIVAPDERRDRVLTEIRRPVFSLLERSALADRCTYISYSSLKELSQQQHLAHLTDTVLDEYAEEAE